MHDKTCEVMKPCGCKGYPLRSLEDVAETEEDISNCIVDIDVVELG